MLLVGVYQWQLRASWFVCCYALTSDTIRYQRQALALASIKMKDVLNAVRHAVRGWPTRQLAATDRNSGNDLTAAFCLQWWAWVVIKFEIR